MESCLFFLLFIFFLLLLFFFLNKKLFFFCKCDLCHAYLTSSWSPRFANLCDWYTHLLQTSPTSTIHIHILNNTITANPSNLEHILKTRFANYPKGKPFAAILGDLLGNGIFNVDGEFWKFQKKMASLELSTASIRSFAFEILSDKIATDLVPLLLSKEAQVLDLQDVFRRFTLDNICRFTFGLDPRCLELSLPISEFAVAFDLASQLSAERALHSSTLIWRIKRFLNIGSERKLKDAIKLINVLAEEIIKQRRKMMNINDTYNHRDLLSRFMITVTDNTYLRDIVVSFILAGRDTVASALTSFFWILSRNREVEAAILTESNRVMEPGQEVASFEQLQEMQYLHAALYESMRLYPPVQFDSKFAEEDDVLPDGTWVGKGTRVTYHAYAMGRMEEVWGPGCLEFKPERWLNNGIFNLVSPYKYPVFQAGVRVCLGKEMAILEMKSVVVSIIRGFEMEPLESNGVIRFTPGLTAGLMGGHRVVIRRRMKNVDEQCK